MKDDFLLILEMSCVIEKGTRNPVSFSSKQHAVLPQKGDLIQIDSIELEVPTRRYAEVVREGERKVYYIPTYIFQYNTRSIEEFDTLISNLQQKGWDVYNR